MEGDGFCFKATRERAGGRAGGRAGLYILRFGDRKLFGGFCFVCLSWKKSEELDALGKGMSGVSSWKMGDSS